MAEEEKRQVKEHLLKAVEVEHRLQVGVLGLSSLSSGLLKRLAEIELYTPYLGEVWDKRIWKRQKALREVLEREVKRAIARGENGRGFHFVATLRKEFEVSAKAAYRLAVTERTRMAVEVARLTLQDNGYKRFVYLPEPRACDRCFALNEAVFSLDELAVGENAPPMHPHCRCAIAPYYEDKDEREERQAQEEAERFESIKKARLQNADKEKAETVGLSGWSHEGAFYPVDGRRVKLEPSAREWEVARVIAERLGAKVELVPRVCAPQNVPTPDYLIDGEAYDLKEILGKGKNVVDGLVKQKQKQAVNFVFDASKTSLSLSEVLGQIKKLYGSDYRQWVQIVILIKENEIIDIFRRK